MSRSRFTQLLGICALLAVGCGQGSVSIDADAALMGDTGEPGSGADGGDPSQDGSTGGPGDMNADTGARGDDGSEAPDADSAASDGGDAGEPDMGPPEPPPTCPTDNMGPGTAPDGTIPGALTFPHPTLRNATILWEISGDANADGVVTVRFRPQGSSTWRRGMPLRRAPADSNGGLSWTDRHSGSLFNLDPATTYDVELFLLDPDGGCEVRNGSVTTRGVPAPMAGAPVKTATPANLPSILANAQPGDIIELEEGNYGPFDVPNDGAQGAPIVIRAQAGATATVNGDLVMSGREYVHVVGLTVNGRIRLNNSRAMAVTNNVVNAVGRTGNGIDFPLRSEDNYVADNVVIGQTVWEEGSLGFMGTNIGEGIRLSGPGHVVEHNRIEGFRDCLSTQETGSGGEDVYSVDFIANDVENCPDDGIEADFCEHNCRVIANRFTNVFVMASSQPGHGGPTYFIRNVGYNVVGAPFKLHNGTIGDVLLHNTVIRHGDAFSVTSSTTFDRQYSRNNVFIGGPGGTYNTYSTGSGRVMWLPAAGMAGDYDYDGFGSTAGTFTGRFGSVNFNSLQELQSMTTEKHAVELTLSDFGGSVLYPDPPFPAHAARNLELDAGGAAIDRGEVIPNINDDFAGAAPDLGAHELGTSAPAYGPR